MQLLKLDDIPHISKLNGKLEGFQAIGSNTTSNPFCISMNDPSKKTKVKKYDLSKNINLENYCNIALFNPSTNFALWTKRKDIIKAYFSVNKKPKNLILIYSNPIISKPITKPPLYFDKVFNAVYKEQFIKEQNCTGQKCKDCLKCYNFSNKKKDNIIYEAVKRPPKNKPLKTICEACYSHKGINFRKHTMLKPLEKNSRLLKTKLTEIQIPKILNRFFRFNHHGELLDN